MLRRAKTATAMMRAEMRWRSSSWYAHVIFRSTVIVAQLFLSIVNFMICLLFACMCYKFLTISKLGCTKLTVLYQVYVHYARVKTVLKYAITPSLS